MSTRSTSRASEVLDALAREQTRRPMYRRSQPSDSSASQQRELWGPDAGQSESQMQAEAGLTGLGATSAQPDEGYLADAVHPRVSRQGSGIHVAPLVSWLPDWIPQIEMRKLGAVVSVLGLVALGVGWTSMRRPASLDERLPIASSAGAAESRSSNPNGGASAGSGTNSTSSQSDLPAAQAAASGADTAAGTGPVFVHVAGAVVSVGVVQLPAGSRVVDAVAAAGGLRPDADSDRVNLAAPLLDGSQVMIPIRGQPTPVQVPVTPAAVSASGVGAPSAGSSSPNALSSGPVNLNTATVEQLDALPGVGPATAQAILSFREKEGRFGSVEALLDVRGIGDAKFEALRELVTV